MICHQHRHSQFLCITDLLPCADPVIAGDDSINPCLCSQIDQFPADPIAILDPVGDIRIHQGPCPQKTFQQYIGRTYSVNIVISDDPDLFFIPDLLHQSVQQLLHSFQ